MSPNITQPPSRAGLVLTPITDRNGRRTQVWRKPYDIGSAQLSRIPFRSNTVATNQFYAVGFDASSIKESPWGKVNNVEEVQPGVYIVNADEGQGVFLTPSRQDEIDPRWNIGENGFYSSEGVGWAVIPYTFPEEFGEDAAQKAEEYLKDYRPREFTEITGEEIPEKDSIVLSAEAFDAAHVGEYAATRIEDGEFPDEVIVTAERIGDEDSEPEEFIVSKTELEDDGELPKGHRKLIDEEKHPKTNSDIEDLKRELKDAIKTAMVARFPRSRYLLSTYYITKATMQGINKKRSAEDEDEYIGKDYGLRGALGGFMGQLIVEITNSQQFPRDVDAEYARELRKYQRKQRTRNWIRKMIG